MCFEKTIFDDNALKNEILNKAHCANCNLKKKGSLCSDCLIDLVIIK
jgi:hypothetical protein